MKERSALRGKGWLSAGANGACVARYFMVAGRKADTIRGVLRTDLAITSLAAIDGGAMLQLADGRLLPIEIIKAYASGAVFGAAGPLI